MTQQNEKREALTRELRKLVNQYDELQAQSGKLLAYIYDHTYAWVSLCVDVGSARTTDEGIKRLAATLKRGHKCVGSWYYCGKYMADNKLEPTRTNHRSVRAIYVHHRSLTKADQLRCVDLVKHQAPHEEVMRILNRSASVLAAQADRKANSLERHGKLNKTRIRMEMLGLLTLARKFYGRADIDVAIIDERGKVLEATGGVRKPKAVVA